MIVLDWMLDADPSIRWQALRDLADAPAEVVVVERARVATDGWGARLLALQGDDGLWEGGALFPCGRVIPMPATGRLTGTSPKTVASPGRPRPTVSCCCVTSGSTRVVTRCVGR
jgi:hypothetical protein